MSQAIQGPISRFGDTAANAGVLTLLAPYDIPVALKTGAASCAAGSWRICIMPIDALKTTLQARQITLFFAENMSMYMPCAF